MPTLKEEMLEAVREMPVVEDEAAPAEPAVEEVAEGAPDENLGEEAENAIDEADETPTISDSEPDDFAELAERYDVDVESLKQFSTVKDAENALALLDKHRLQMPQQDAAMDSLNPSTVPLDDEPSLDLGELDKDDPLAKVLIAQHEKANQKIKQVREELAAFRSLQQQQQAQQVLAHANSVLDKLASERYGDSSQKLSPVQERNRTRTLKDAMLFAAAKQGAGEKVDLEKIIQRTDRAEFAIAIAKEQAKKKQAAIEQRAGHKLGTTSRAPSDMPASGKTYTGPLKNDPVFMRLAKQAVGRGR